MIEQQEKQPQREEAFVGLMMSEKNGKFRQITKDISLDYCLLFLDAKKCSNFSDELTRTTWFVVVDSDTGELINTISTRRHESTNILP